MQLTPLLQQLERRIIQMAAGSSPDITESVPPDRLTTFLNDVLGGFHPARVESHIAGFSNVTCFVYRDGNEYVLRRPPAGLLLPTAHDVVREHRFLNALHPTAARVPRPIAVCEDPEVIGAPFYLMERKHGFVIRDELPEVFSDPGDRRRIGLEMTDTLAELHSVDWQATGLRGKAEGYLDRQINRWSSQADLTVGKVRNLPGLQEVTDWLKSNKPGESDSTVVHGDYKLDNVMFASELPVQLISMFDWEMATIGDPLADLGWLMNMWGKPPGWQEDDPLPTTALPGFAARDELAARYAEKSGRRMEHFSWYQVMATWKLLLILEGLYVHYMTGTASNPDSARFEIQVPTLVRRAQLLIDET